TRLVEGDEFDSRRELLAQAMQNLNERERDILVQRRLTDEPTTLEDLSTRYGISRERVRQIEVRAFEKLQKAVRGAAARRDAGEAVATAWSSGPTFGNDSPAAQSAGFFVPGGPNRPVSQSFRQA